MKQGVKHTLSAELKALLASSKNIETQKGVLLSLMKDVKIAASTLLSADEAKGYKAIVYTNKLNLCDFMADHRIGNLNELEGLEPDHLWEYYLRGRGCIGIRNDNGLQHGSAFL